MQGLDWNDLRVVLAVFRAGTLTAAARKLGIDATTVGRRIRTVEAALGSRLFERLPDGSLRPTGTGETALDHAERVEAGVAGLMEAVGGVDGTPAGTVRVTAVPILVGRVLVSATAACLGAHPGLTLELIAESRDASLVRREADLAVRLARPSGDAGRAILARRIGYLAYAAYGPAGASGTGRMPGWIGYDDTMSTLPQARWLAAAARREGGASLALNDAEAIVQAVRAGLGRSLLPSAIADGIEGLRRIPLPDRLTMPPRREIWLLTHPDFRHTARIAAVWSWLERTLGALAATPRDASAESRIGPEG